MNTHQNIHQSVDQGTCRLPLLAGVAIVAVALAGCETMSERERGTAQGAQADEPKVGITANQGLFGHGSSVILTR